jgi:L-ribulose-5-phosphate 3-epimerase
MKTGISALVIPTDWSFDDTLTRIREAGYESLELVIRDDGYLTLDSTPGELDSLRSRADRAGIELSSLCAGMKNRPRDLMASDPEERARGLDTHRECIRVAGRLGIDTILVVPGRVTADLFYDVAYANARSSMREIAFDAEAAGVRLAIEYVWNKFLLSPMEFAQFCDEVGSRCVGFYFDPGNMAIFGFPEHWVRICGRHLMAVHLKDFRRTGSVWTPLLEGDVDFAAIMRELRTIGFDGPLISEVESSLETFEATARKIGTIRAM